MNSFIPFTDLYCKVDCFANVKGKKKNREEKNVLALSALGFSIG